MGVVRGVKTLLLAGVLIGLGIPAFAQQAGIQLWSLRNQFAADGVDKTFSKINDWGLTAIEGGGNLYNLNIHEFKALLNKYHLHIPSVDTNFEEVETNPMAVVYKANFFGSQYATFYWVPHDGEFTFEDAKKTVAVMNSAGAILKKHGITLQYHPHGYEFAKYKDGVLLDYILQNVTEAKFEMDVYWIKFGGGDPVDLLRKYPESWTSLHLKDRAHGVAGKYQDLSQANMRAMTETNVVLGKGDVGLKAIVKQAKQQGIRYFFIEDESSRVLSQVPQSIEFLNNNGVY